MRKHSFLIVISIFLLLSLVAFAQSKPDWVQQTAKAKDVAVSHDGKAWFIGVDGRAYTKSGETWQAFGTRNNLVRIDAGSKSAVAIASDGMVYLANNNGQWKSLNVRAKDVGIGANTIWLAGENKVSKGLFNTSGNITWQSINGILKTIDVDPEGNAWGVDRNGRIFVYDGEAWIADTLAPKASDIGIGGDDSIFIVGAEIDQKQGGGRVYSRNGTTGKWATVPGRLSAISVTQDGKAFGANSLNWLIAATGKGTQNVQVADNISSATGTSEKAKVELPTNLVDESTYKVSGNMTLADIIGNNVPGASKVELSEVAITESSIAGTAKLNGSPVRAVLHQPDPKSAVFIAGLEHASVDLANYIPKIRKMNLGSFGLLNAVFYMRDEGESTEAITYDDFPSMPEALSQLLQKQKDVVGLFPLTVHPGVTVIGTYSLQGNTSKDKSANEKAKNEEHMMLRHTKAIMGAYGIEEKAYAVKGHFKLKQLQNLSFDLPRPAGGSSNSSAQTQPTGKEACVALTSIDSTGLDLSFPIPSFKPPYVKGAIKFNNAKFSLKEIDGKLEPSILTMMDLKFPNIKAGIQKGGTTFVAKGATGAKAANAAKEAAMADMQTVSMAGKLSVLGSLNELCDGLNKNTQGAVSFAGSTAFNIADVSKASFDALSRVTGTTIENPAKEKEKTKSIAPDMGWKRPFGIPFLTINEFASAGTFEQKQEGGQLKRTMKSSIWTKSVTDRAVLDVFGSVDLDIKADSLALIDWLLQSKGVIAFNDLPGLKDMPKVDEFAVSDITLTPNVMTGSLLRGSGNAPLDAKVYFEMVENKPAQLFIRFAELKPNTIYDFIPAAVANVKLSPAIIGWSEKETTELLYADAPAKLKPLLAGLIAVDDGLTIAKGLTLGGKTTAKDIFGGKVTGLINDVIDIDGGISMFGAFSQQTGQSWSGEMRAALAQLKINGISDELMTFKGSELVLSNLNGNVLAIETTADVKVPEKAASVEMTGTLTYEQPVITKELLTLALSSPASWDNPLRIPDLKITGLGFNASFEKEGAVTDQSMGFSGSGELRSQPGTIGINVSAGNSSLTDAVVSFESDNDGFNISEFLGLPTGAEKIANAKIKTLLLSANAVAADMQFNLGKMAFNGRGAIIKDKGATKAALFLRSDNELKIGKMLNFIPPPMDSLTIPKGLIIVSAEAVNSFNAGGIPDAIYEQVLGGLVDKQQAASLLVEDGVTFMTKVNPSSFPAPIPKILETPFGLTKEIYIAGSVGGVFNGSDPSLGFYTILKGVTPTLPSFVKEFIDFENGNLKIFVNSKQGAAFGVDIGMAVDAKIKPRRLDDPTVVQPLDGTFALTYGATSNPADTAITASASVKSDWKDPLGLEGYTFKDASIGFGIEPNGTSIAIHTKRAIIPGNKAFVLDLDTTWVGGAPTDLAVQFERADKTKDLVLTPADLVKLQKSFFDLAFRSGSKLKDAVLLAFNKLPTPQDPILKTLKQEAPKIINTVSRAITAANDGMTTLIENSPLSMIGVKNPVIYFGTPGSTPPSNPDITPPPLGLGLHVAGAFRVDMGGSLSRDLASGTYKVNLKDGYYFDGSMKAPPPFEANDFTVKGNLPFLGGAQFLTFEGDLKVAGASLANGSFNMTRGSMLSTTASVTADVKILGALGRKGTMSLAGTSLTFNSPGGCTDFPPVDISGSLSLTNLTSDVVTTALNVFDPTKLPNPIECAVDLANAVADIATGTFKAVTNPLDTSKVVVGEVVAVFSDPVAAINSAANIAEMPLNMADALGGAGISLVKMGVEKIPLLGPGTGKVIGAAFDQANELKDAAVNAIKNNVVTGFLTESFGKAAGAIIGGIGKVGGATLDAIGLGGSKKATWWSTNPVKCIPGVHYWNPIFKQCFANGAMVLFDNASRGNNAMGDCMQASSTVFADNVRRFRKDAVKVGACSGIARNQFHLNSITDQIQAVNKAYHGYTQAYYGPDYRGCLARRARASDDGKWEKDDVYVAHCSTGNANQKWTFTDDMKLKNANACVHRTATNQLKMGACENANQWLGTSVVPDWNLAKNVPLRGQITHKATGKTMYWQGGNSLSARYVLHTSKEISKLKADKHLLTHVRLRVLGDDNILQIMGSAPAYGYQYFGCLGTNGTDNVSSRHCRTNEDMEDAKWRVRPVNADGTLGSGKLSDILNGDYVLINKSRGKCLTVDKNEINMTKVVDCGVPVNNNVKFRGYTPDHVATSVFEKAAAKERAAFDNTRLKALNSIKKWQRHRVRAENARIDQVHKIVTMVNNSTNPYTRKSPGQCAHGEFWSQSLKVCAKDRRMLFNYHNSNGEYEGCLHADSGYYGAKLTTHCQTASEYDAVVDGIAFYLDALGRIIKKNVAYQVTAEARESKSGKTEHYITGTKAIEKGDLCLGPNRSVKKINGKVALDFLTCNDSSTKWRYSVRGELLSESGLCARNEAHTTRAYSLENVNKVYGLAKKGTAEFDRLKKENPFYITTTTKNLVLTDCEVDEMANNERRWQPTVSNNYSEYQGLPETARLSLNTTSATAPKMCVTGDMFINGNMKLQACTAGNKDQYFAFGGTDDARFLISSRNSKTCLYDAGNNQVSHRVCTGSGAEMFMKAPSETSAHKIISALSGSCLGYVDADLVQVSCDNAPSFVMDVVENVDNIAFEGVNKLKANQERTAVAQTVWNKAKHRATLLYAGTYLKSGNAILEKGDDDLAYMKVPTTVTLEKLRSHVAPGASEVIYIPEVTVPKTQIMLLPGFDSSDSAHVTFAHAKPVIGAGGEVIRDHTSDPMKGNYGDWFVWSHRQKVMRIVNGAIRFEYIDESDAFRKSASFKMTAVTDDIDGLYTFESVSNAGQFLNVSNGMLTLTNNRMGLSIESASQWLKNRDLDVLKFEPPYRKARPLFTQWKFPDDDKSVLNKY